MRLLVFVLLTGCSDVFGPQTAEGVPFTPPAYYTELWRQVDSCSGKPRSMTGLRFAVATIPKAAGQYEPWNDRILLAPYIVQDSIRRVQSDWLVRHEMLHAHIPYDRRDQHPREYFIVRCGPLVNGVVVGDNADSNGTLHISALGPAS